VERSDKRKTWIEEGLVEFVGSRRGENKEATDNRNVVDCVA
jgi:hypothetical protein